MTTLCVKVSGSRSHRNMLDANALLLGGLRERVELFVCGDEVTCGTL
jgi:hypothetical protein